MQKDPKSSRREANISSSKRAGIQLAAVAELYSRGLKEHGTSSPSVGWPEAEAHRLRFAKLTELLVPTQDSEVSVADLGCGYGALFDYLVERETSLKRYVGYDISSEMLEEARQRINSPIADFIESAEIDEEFDYSIVCGTFNVKLKIPKEDWGAHIDSTLRNINKISKRGFAFNLLTKYVDYEEDHLFYGDPLYFFDLCKREFSDKVSLLHDYPLYEWTIIVRK